VDCNWAKRAFSMLCYHKLRLHVKNLDERVVSKVGHQKLVVLDYNRAKRAVSIFYYHKVRLNV
jgi:hypothetical protein